MSRIRGKDTKPEMYVRKFLYGNGFRYRLHYKKLLGKPDVVLVGKNVIIDIKGCYWHRHTGCRYATTPSSNVDFYLKKFADTVERDKRNIAYWKEEGWKVIEVWECELKTAESRKQRLEELLQEITR